MNRSIVPKETQIKNKRKNEKSCECGDLVLGWWVGEMREHVRRQAFEKMRRRRMEDN